MTLTPAIKGQLTKAVKAATETVAGYTPSDKAARFLAFKNVCAVFARHMPREQAKHATRKYLAGKADA